jgi:Zn-dependent protease with chaperone function
MSYIPTIFVVLPFVATLIVRHSALRGTNVDRTAWMGYRRLTRFIMLATIAGWTAIWNSNGSSDPARAPLFWLQPILGLGLYLTVCFAADRTILGLRWSAWDILQLAWWRIVSFVVPLLMIASGFHAAFEGRGRSILWVACAGIVAKLGTAFLRRAQGIRLHEAKSGELRNHAFSVARRMGATIQRVYIVPAGKGHLVNAYGGSDVIGVTDNWGKHFARPEMEYILAHEVAHAKQRHGGKQLLFIIVLFAFLVLILFQFRGIVSVFQPLLDVLVIAAPVMLIDFLSRRFEYAADREAVNFTGDPEVAVRALATLYEISDEPIGCSWFTELFLTHPSLRHRAQAIARTGPLADERVAEILRVAGASQDSSSRR